MQTNADDEPIETDEFGDEKYIFCFYCDEEFSVPEDFETCPICGETAIDL